jgi:predicted secreted Zn-dependent protease
MPRRPPAGSADADIAASYTIYIPRWTEPKRVPKRLLDWWRRIVDFIADHEAGHVRIGRDYIRKAERSSHRQTVRRPDLDRAELGAAACRRPGGL